MDFGNILEELLRKKKIKVPYLAEITGINKNTLYSYIRRNTQKVDPVVIQKIANALDVDIDYFLGTIPGEENRPVKNDEPERDEFIRLFASLNRENRQRILDLMKVLAAGQVQTNVPRQ